MSPDFEFFVHLRPVALWSHTLVGLVGFCLPVGLAVVAMWQFVVREPVQDLLGFTAQPWQGDASWSWWLRAAIGVLMGAASHLIWDGLTHGDYWGAQLWPGLRTTAVSWGTLSVPWFNVLQHVSTLVGGIVVLVWCYATVRARGDMRGLVRSEWRRRAVATILFAAVLGGLMNGSRGPFGSDFWIAQRLLGRIAVGAMLGAAVGVLWVPLRRRATSAHRLLPVLAAALIGGCSLVPEIERREVARVGDATGALDAVLVLVDAGATMSVAYLVFVVPRGARAPEGLERAVASLDGAKLQGGYTSALRWASTGSLVVEYVTARHVVLRDSMPVIGTRAVRVGLHAGTVDPLSPDTSSSVSPR